MPTPMRLFDVTRPTDPKEPTMDTTPAQLTQRVTITLSSACEPTAHAEGCRDLAKVRRRNDYQGEYASSFASLTELSLDYWSDIVHSDHGLEGVEAEELAREFLHEIQVAPCVKLPLRTDTGRVVQPA